MTNKLRGFGQRDLVAVLIMVALLILLGIPTLAQSRRLNRRQACAHNLKRIGTAAKIYANDNNENWMIPAFKRSVIDNGGIDYLAGDRVNVPPADPSEVGYDRQAQSTSETPFNPDGGSTAVSVTRAYWMLVRSGYPDVETFICPASRDIADPTLVPEWYYDFEGYRNISYGYQVPFGPRGNRPSESSRHDMPLAADKGPYYLSTFEPTFQIGSKNPISFDDPLGRWRRFNSPNHHRQGQNVLFAGGSVSFEQTPAAGIHGDNIYTLMVDGWDETGFNRIHGESPHFATVAAFPYPGQGVFGPGLFSSTDSLIYP